MITGSPAGLTAAAGAIDAAVGAAAAAPTAVDTARSTARGGWTGEAAEAFEESASGTRTRLQEFIRTAGTASSPLRTYASALQAAQIAFAAAITPAERAAAVAQALAANQTAAAAISAIRTDQETASFWKTSVKGTSIATGLVLGGLRAYELEQAKTATKTVTGPVTGKPLEVADKAARARFGTVAQRIRWGGWALAPVFAGAGQLAADSANPSLTAFQRTGRTAAQAVTVGGTSIVASALAGAAMGSWFPGAGTLVGAGVGIAASLIAGGTMDYFNDGLVNMAGDATESASQWFGSAADKVGGALDSITPW